MTVSTSFYGRLSTYRRYRCQRREIADLNDDTLRRAEARQRIITSCNDN
ncbi:hypothetical protein [Novosphingobium sp. B1]